MKPENLELAIEKCKRLKELKRLLNCLNTQSFMGLRVITSNHDMLFDIPFGKNDTTTEYSIEALEFKESMKTRLSNDIADLEKQIEQL